MKVGKYVKRSIVIKLNSLLSSTGGNNDRLKFIICSHICKI